MKKYIMLASLALLNGCAASPNATDSVGTATAIGENIFRVAIDNQCRAELRANTAFRTVALTMTAQQQDVLETNICGCVSEQAVQNVTVVDMAQAATNPTARGQIIANTVAKTLGTCYSRFMNR